MAIDLVCNMEVDESNPPGGQTEHEGQTYYFCAPGCKRVFERDPEKYLQQGGTTAEPHTMEGDASAADEPGKARPSFLARLFGKKD